MIAAPLFTIVLPTYNRPETLRTAVRSVVNQTVSSWKLLVLGDCCSDSSAAAMQDFSQDERIVYVNFSRRSGEQALLNSAGTIVADSEYICYLNHDDIWFPDHLEIASSALVESGSEFFMGRAATVKSVRNNGKPFPSVSLKYAHPCNRAFGNCYFSNINYFEPVSSWVLKTAFAKDVGPWKISSELFRTPIQEWIMRAWRAGGKLAFDKRITCFRMANHHRPRADASANQYSVGAEMHYQLLDLFLRHSVDEVRANYSIQVFLASLRRQRMRRTIPSRSKIARIFELVMPFYANRYIKSGIDVFDNFCEFLSVPKGKRWEKALASRTGESLVQGSCLDEIVAELRSEIK